MKQESERIFIGKQFDIPVGDVIKSQLQSFQNEITQELNSYIQLEDIPDILKNGSKEISVRFEAYLWKLNSGIKHFIDRERHKIDIPFKIKDFNEKCDRIKGAYDALPDYLKKEKLLGFYFDDHFKRITCKWDNQLLNQAIQEQCELYAETPKEVEAINCIREMIDAGNRLKTLVGVPMNATDVMSDSINQETVKYNVEFIDRLFKKFRS